MDESEKPGSPPQDRDRNTKLERNTSTAAESDPGNDIDTQLHSHAAEKLSWNSIMCRVGLVGCEDCARHHRASTHKHDEHQNQATSEVTLSAGLGQTIVIEIVVHARYQNRSYYYNVLAPWLNGYPQPLASALAVEKSERLEARRIGNEFLMRGVIKIGSCQAEPASNLL